MPFAHSTVPDNSLLPFAGQGAIRVPNDGSRSAEISLESIFENGFKFGERVFSTLQIDQTMIELWTEGQTALGRLQAFPASRGLEAPMGSPPEDNDGIWVDLNTERDSVVVTWSGLVESAPSYTGNPDHTFQIEIRDLGDGDSELIYRFNDLSNPAEIQGFDSYIDAWADYWQTPFPQMGALRQWDETPGNTGIAGVWQIRLDNGQVVAADLELPAPPQTPGPLRGTEGDDDITGLGGSENTIIGLAGNDTLTGGSQQDVIYGGNGNNRLFGGFGNDTIVAGSGDDYIESGRHDDLIGAGAGNDTIINIDGFDTVYGGDGNDSIVGPSSSQFYSLSPLEAYGGNGSDTVTGGRGNDLIYGGDGGDLLSGGDSGRDRIYGEGGNDTLLAGGWVGSLYGGDGADSLRGSGQGDSLYGGDGSDTLSGGVGRDSLYGGTGDDTLIGEDGNFGRFWFQTNDVLDGGDGNDSLFGGAGNDSLYGGTGDDTLIGGYNDDALYGGAGDDFIFGSIGRNVATGGDGADRFFNTPVSMLQIYQNARDGYGSGASLRITDYDASEGDALVLDGTVFSADDIGLSISRIQTLDGTMQEIEALAVIHMDEEGNQMQTLFTFDNPAEIDQIILRLPLPGEAGEILTLDIM